MPPEAVGVIDIGKTNAKILAVQPNATAELIGSFAHQPVRATPYNYQALDTEGIWDWLLKVLGELASRFTVNKLVVTAHGATATVVDEQGLVFPVLDYEDNAPDEIEHEYKELRPPFTESYSAPLPGSLNCGRGLYWLSRKFKDDFARTKHILLYAQYWTWRLSGVAALEVSSIGSHSDLWSPKQNTFSSLIDKLNWQQLFAPRLHASDVLGPLKSELCAQTGLSEDCKILCGIHDSNASLLMWLDRPPPFTVVSTGTWVIMFAVGGKLEAMNPERDCTANVSVDSDPVVSSRWMGGREYANLSTLASSDSPDLKQLQAGINAQAMFLPPQNGQGGPYIAGPGGSHLLDGNTHAPAARELYCALMLDTCLDFCNKHGDIIVEGPFASNKTLCGLLAAFRSKQHVLASSDATGTATGAARLAYPQIPAPQTTLVKPLAVTGIEAYRNAWRNKAS